MLLLQTTTSDAFYIVMGALFAFITMFAAFLTALGIIWSKGLKPIRDKFNERIFNPLEEATKKVIEIGESLTQLSSRLESLENTIKTVDLLKFNDSLRGFASEIAYLRFKLRRSVKHSPEPTFILDENGDCNFVNFALCDLMDADSSELEGKNWTAKIVSSERSNVLREWQAAYSGHSVFEMPQHVMIRGKKTRILVTAEPFIYEGKVTNYFGTVKMIPETD